MEVLSSCLEKIFIALQLAMLIISKKKGMSYYVNWNKMCKDKTDRWQWSVLINDSYMKMLTNTCLKPQRSRKLKM